MSQRSLDQSGGASFRDPGQDGLLHRAFLRGSGFSADDVRRSPVIGVSSSWSELNPCNAGLKLLVEAVKLGVSEAGGVAIEFPTISISEPFTRPTSMYLRNLMSMDVEETVRTAPIDGVVLLGGCDKTVPAQIMGAISAGKPAILVTAGPRPVSEFRGAPFASDDVWPICDARRLGAVSDAEWLEVEERLVLGPGTCNVMGTALTMAAVAETLGFALPGSSLPPAASAERSRIAHATGRRIVELVAEDRAPTAAVTMDALENAVRVVCALGGSTNAIIHLEAIAGRAGLRVGAQRLAEWLRSTPYLANVRPGGEYPLSALDEAGGIPAVIDELGGLFHRDAVTATARNWSETLDARRRTGHPAIAPRSAPLAESSSLVALTGNLAPQGALVKTAGTTDARLRRHRGRVVVFDGVEDLNDRIDDPDLSVDADSILVLRGVGMLGAPGMPEVGHIPIPAKLGIRGVEDMIRISDARMSGTSTGTVVLHVTPEGAMDGPLARLRDGDIVELDVDAGTLTHFVDDDELAARRPAARPPSARRGYRWLFSRHALQPDEGCDFDFLVADGVSGDRPATIGARAGER